MRILFLDPFHGGSHKAVAEGFARHSQHSVELLTLPQDGGWRWRMRGAAVTFARMLREQARPRWDRIITTDMLDLATFRGLTQELTAGIPAALYFHENQLTYPLPPGRTRDLAFPWINYTSALAADALFFNSDFHRRSFLEALPSLPGRYHDYQESDVIAAITARAEVLPPGIDLARLDTPDPPAASDDAQPPVLLWNSRWEYDKGPATFFAALRALAARGVDFRAIIVGEHIDPHAPEFADAYAWLGPRLLAWGYVPDLAAYRRLLWRADIVVSSALQEFFGISVVEALYCGCVPILPRRLSYPELLPPEHHAACLYDDDAALVDQLHAAIRNLAELRTRDFRAIAARYDWRHMAPRYDAALEALRG
jgi:glycosyltransferase involved in cell wall biosynthesis